MAKFDLLQHKLKLEKKRKEENPDYYNHNTIGVKLTKTVMFSIGAFMFWSLMYSYHFSFAISALLTLPILGVYGFFMKLVWTKKVESK